MNKLTDNINGLLRQLDDRSCKDTNCEVTWIPIRATVKIPVLKQWREGHAVHNISMPLFAEALSGTAPIRNCEILGVSR